MPFDIELDEEHGLIKICHKDEMTSHELFLVRTGSAFAADLRGWHRVLLDFKKANIEMDASEFADHFRKLDFDAPTGAYVAIVEPCDCDFDYCRMAKSVANSWTASTVETFQDERDAFDWLCSCGKCRLGTREQNLSGGRAVSAGGRERCPGRP